MCVSSLCLVEARIFPTRLSTEWHADRLVTFAAFLMMPQQAAAVSRPVANPKPCSAAASRAAAALEEKAIQTPHAIATCHMFLCLRHGRLSVILLHMEYSLHSSEDGYSTIPLAVHIVTAFLV